jgi:LmbE family N-acetylglucosaminyl deacetylase
VSKLQRSSGHEIFRWLASPGAGNDISAPAVLFLAAHPDDEVIGASAALGRLKNSLVVFLTDGAPADPRFRSSLVSGTREAYAALRAGEAARALALVGIAKNGTKFLGGSDQESIFEIPKLLEAVLGAIQSFRPQAIITHPYEGGHPDHDCASLLAYLAVELSGWRELPIPTLLEMTSYHARDGHRVTGEFLSTQPEPPALTLELSPGERQRKARMLKCYASQEAVLSDFPLEPERLRVAPHYDFSQPPHEGPLWYECLNWPLRGARWREMASEALEKYGHLSCH